MSAAATHTEGTISARMAVRVVDFAARRGHDPEALCRDVGLSLRALRDPEGRVPYALAEALGERALELTADANFGLHLAQDVGDVSAYDAGVLMLMASPTVRVALERMERHQRYWGDGERSTLLPVPGGLVVRYVLASNTPGAQRHADECALAEVTLGVRMLAAAQVVPRVARFRHASPRDTREHEALFGCRLEFGASCTEIVFDDAALDLTLRHANAAYCDIFQKQVERALARLPPRTRVSAAAREAARFALTAGQCNLAATARALGIGTRTLQRRLRAEDTSFHALVDSLRRELALAYLDQQVAIQEIASLLGYADVTAFQHAFRRWTGETPKLVRARRHGGG